MLRPFILVLEFSSFFIVIPLLMCYRVLPNAPIPFLLIGALTAFFVLHHDPTFPGNQFYSWNNVRPHLVPLLLRDAVCLALLAVAVRLFAPHLLFSLIRRAPGLWVLVMLLYPLVSVYPQELLYRAFFFHRYQPLFGSGWGMIVASGLAFGFVHIIFRNHLALVFCIVGGFLFSLTYQQSGSLLLACLDHAIFGNFIFTIGLGQFFYHGSRV